MSNVVKNIILLVVFVVCLALIVIGMDLLFITSDNAGGHIAHLGGALAGLFFAAQLGKGRDLTAWINRALDGMTALVHRKPRKPKMKGMPLASSPRLTLSSTGKTSTPRPSSVRTAPTATRELSR